MPRPKLTKIAWRSEQDNIKDILGRTVVASDSSYQYDDGYLKDIFKNVEKLESIQIKLHISSAILAAMLFINLFSGTRDFSFLGVSATNIEYIAEVLLLVSVILPLYASVLQISINEMKTVGGAIIDTKYDDQVTRSLVKLRMPSLYGHVLPHSFGRQPGHLRTLGYRAFLSLVVVTSFLPVLLAIFLPFVIQVYAWWDLWGESNFGPSWGYILSVLVALGLFSRFVIGTLHILKLPYRDYSLVLELDSLRDTDREAYEKRLHEILKGGTRK